MEHLVFYTALRTTNNRLYDKFRIIKQKSAHNGLVKVKQCIVNFINKEVELGDLLNGTKKKIRHVQVDGVV